jgi:hypothetical protein
VLVQHDHNQRPLIVEPSNPPSVVVKPPKVSNVLVEQAEPPKIYVNQAKPPTIYVSKPEQQPIVVTKPGPQPIIVAKTKPPAMLIDSTRASQSKIVMNNPKPQTLIIRNAPSRENDNVTPKPTFNFESESFNSNKSNKNGFVVVQGKNNTTYIVERGNRQNNAVSQEPGSLTQNVKETKKPSVNRNRSMNKNANALSFR